MPVMIIDESWDAPHRKSCNFCCFAHLLSASVLDGFNYFSTQLGSLSIAFMERLWVYVQYVQVRFGHQNSFKTNANRMEFRPLISPLTASAFRQSILRHQQQINQNVTKRRPHGHLAIRTKGRLMLIFISPSIQRKDNFFGERNLKRNDFSLEV